MRPPPRTGATLVSALLALSMVALCGVLLLQTCLMGGIVHNRLAVRAEALARCQSQMESLRARGTGSLPASSSVRQGRFTVATTVSPGPAPGMRAVAVRVSWQPGQRLPAGSVRLATIMSARGMSP